MPIVDNRHGAVPIQEIRVPRVDVAGLHGDEVLDELVGRVHNFLEEGDDDLVEFLFQRWVAAEHLLGEEAGEDADEFVVDEADAFEGGFFEALDLLLDDQLEGRGADEERGAGAGAVVQDGPDVDVLDLVEGVDGFDAVGVELVEDKGDTRAAGEFDGGKLLVGAFEHGAVLVAELGDDVEDDVAAVAEHAVAELGELGGVLLEGGGNARLDVGEGLFDVHHENLRGLLASLISVVCRRSMSHKIEFPRQVRGTAV